MSNESKGGILVVTDYAQPGNHIAKILEVITHNPLRRGTVSHVSVAHDDWCSLLAGKGACDCAPIVTFLGRVG